MEKIKIKCPVCGNGEFLKIEPPYHCGMDTYIQEYTKYFACLKCGLVLRFAKDIVDNAIEQAFLETDNGKKWFSLDKELKNLSSSIRSLEKRNDDLHNRMKDDNRSVASDRQMRNELKENQNKLCELKKRCSEIEKEMEKLRQ